MSESLKIIASLLILIIVFAAAAPASETEFAVSLLTPGTKVIPITWKVGGYWTTDIKPPSLVVKDISVPGARIEGVAMVGKTGGRESVVVRLGETEITASIAAANPLLNKQIARPSRFRLGIANGEVAVPDRPFKETNELNPGDSLCLRLCDLAFLVFRGPAKIDEMLIQVDLRHGETRSRIEYAVPLLPYICRGDYVFPLKGNLAVVGLPLGLDHRTVQSQEFAFDTLESRQSGTGEWVTASKPKADDVRDYYIFHRDVLAVGDGVVVARGDRYPDALAANPQLYSQEQFATWARDLVKKGVDQANVLAGNYLVIDHRNGEFSFYAHLSENTLAVKPGDEVRRGQVIAQVGNTGNSTEPHLHFQLMDGPDYTKANGLPFIVKNRAGMTLMDFPNGVEYVNTFLYSDFLFIYVR